MTIHRAAKPSWFYGSCATRGLSARGSSCRLPGPAEKRRKDRFDGDTDRQIEAIWYFLSLGTSAPDPSGVDAIETKLFVDRRHAHVSRPQQRCRLSRHRGRLSQQTELRLQRRDRHADGDLARRIRAVSIERARVGRISTGQPIRRPGRGVSFSIFRTKNAVAAPPHDDQRNAGRSRSALSQESRLSVQGILHGRCVDSDVHVSQRRHRDRRPFDR